MKREDSKPKPILWECTCPWIGTAEQMKEGCCPKCGSFKNVRVSLVNIIKREAVIDFTASA